jgi:hypothetical protein
MIRRKEPEVDPEASAGHGKRQTEDFMKRNTRWSQLCWAGSGIGFFFLKSTLYKALSVY